MSDLESVTLIINRIRKWFRHFRSGSMGKHACESKLTISVGGLGILIVKWLTTILSERTVKKKVVFLLFQYSARDTSRL